MNSGEISYAGSVNCNASACTLSADWIDAYADGQLEDHPTLDLPAIVGGEVVVNMSLAGHASAQGGALTLDDAVFGGDELKVKATVNFLDSATFTFAGATDADGQPIAVSVRQVPEPVAWAWLSGGGVLTWSLIRRRLASR